MENKKSNKAKKSLLILAIALMMALVIGMGAFTYSKYVSTQSTGDKTATAAQWGFVVTVNADNLFGTDYTLDSGSLATVTTTDNGVAVNAVSSAQVVAPGTTGSMTISVNGSAEVLAKLTITTSSTSTDIYLGDYYPIKWTLKDGSSTLNTIDTTLSGALSALRDDIKNVSGTAVDTDGGIIIEANTSISKTYTLSWEWAFEDSDTTNTKDTILGLLAANKTVDDINQIYGAGTVTAGSYSTQISFNLTVTVEQIQTATTTP